MRASAVAVVGAGVAIACGGTAARDGLTGCAGTPCGVTCDSTARSAGVCCSASSCNAPDAGP